MKKQAAIADPPKIPGLREMSILNHLRELRTRLIVGSVAIFIGSILAFVFFDQIVAILFRPFESIGTLESENQLFINTLFEGFVTKLKVSVLAGTIISFPVHLYNIIRFVFPGLKGKEKKMIVIGLIASFVLSAFSFYYSYFRIIPLSVRFLTGDHFIPLQVGMLLNYQRNIFYILQFIFVSLLVFQTPIILELLLVMNVVGRKTLLKASRHVIVLIFILSAVLTPPDFISQVSLAAP
ncbi:MAG: twin-arginine translocase subunit TatC, partial [Spirochaetia bacterium]